MPLGARDRVLEREEERIGASPERGRVLSARGRCSEKAGGEKGECEAWQQPAVERCED